MTGGCSVGAAAVAGALSTGATVSFAGAGVAGSAGASCATEGGVQSRTRVGIDLMNWRASGPSRDRPRNLRRMSEESSKHQDAAGRDITVGAAIAYAVDVGNHPTIKFGA
jgi:hypothetical protein